MQGLTFTQLVRNYTKTNSTTFPDTEIVLLGNSIKDTLAQEIVETKEDDFVIPATRDLVADQREYGLPEDKIDSISKVEVKFNDDSDYIPLVETDLNIKNSSIEQATQESLITQNFSNEKGGAKYDIIRGSLYIYSGTIQDVTDGIKLYYSVFPQDIEVGDLINTQDLSIPESDTSVAMPRVFHELWARKISMTWKSTREKPIPFSELELAFDNDWGKAISNYRVGNTDRGLQANLPDDTRLQG